jgi:hypothetical protein
MIYRPRIPKSELLGQAQGAQFFPVMYIEQIHEFLSKSKPSRSVHLSNTVAFCNIPMASPERGISTVSSDKHFLKPRLVFEQLAGSNVTSRNVVHRWLSRPEVNERHLVDVLFRAPDRSVAGRLSVNISGGPRLRTH